ncbi:MAG: type II toxin-antitoxin system prevent-host-death family antitoxin [Bacillota bacterium]
MEFATSKELRLRAGEILAKVRAGRRFIITYRGKPVALLVPVEIEEAGFTPRPYAEAWADIEQALENSAPYYPGWREALRESRRQK